MNKALDGNKLSEQQLSSTSTQQTGSSDKFPTYKKLDGTIDVGREYEQIMSAYYALTLAVNDEVKDFEMSSNNKENGKFDDIGLNVTFRDGKSRSFLFQLKHKNSKNKNIIVENLKSKKSDSDFGVETYISSITEKGFDEDTICILYTNSPTQMKDKIELTEEIDFEQRDQVEFQEFFLNTQKDCENAIFEVKSENLKPKFYFFTSQLNVKDIEEQLNANLKNLMQCDIHNAWTSYMRYWWSGKFIMKKHDVIAKITELAFSPYLKSLTGDKCNEKTESLKKAVMNFPLTIVEECEEHIVEKIWKIEDSWTEGTDFSKARNKYGLKIQQMNTVLWYLEKIPLVVKVDPSHEGTIKRVMDFLLKDTKAKKIVLIGNISKTDFGYWRSLRSLWDLTENKKESPNYSEITQKFSISFQGRGGITLENLIKGDTDVARLIGIRELLKMSQTDYLLVGDEKKQLSGLHIPRFITPVTPIAGKESIKETEVFKHFRNPLHVFCAPPGMGKSRLMTVLYNSCPPEFPAVQVSLIDHNSFLATTPDSQKILARFLGTDSGVDDFFKQLKRHFWRKQQLHMFLDGLDEVDGQHVEVVLNFVKQVTSEGAKVWLSSRENLRERIQQVLNVEPIEIKELRKDEQEQFIRIKLKEEYTDEKIRTITSAVFSSTDLNNSQNLLGIPLQLHIITEMFLNDKDVYNDVEKKNLFVLTKMYRVFFEGKIKFSFDKLVHENQQSQFGYVGHMLLGYEILALKTCLNSEDYEKFKLEANDEDFLQQLETNGDKHGIIKTVNADGQAIFNHQTYAEYFAASWFKKNKDKVELLKDRIFSSEYENLRLLFDVMLAEEHPLHLAIIYQDNTRFEKNIRDANLADVGGRTAFHLAFSYGQKYQYSSIGKKKHETPFFIKIMETLLNKDKLPDQKDELFGFDCVRYALRSMCLYPIEKTLEKKLLDFETIKEEFYRYYDQRGVVDYSARYGYPNLLSKCIKKYQSNLKNLMVLAISGCEDADAPSTKGNIEAIRVLIANGAPLYGMLERACEYKRFNILEVLEK